MRFHVGTSGWSYHDWKTRVYPVDLHTDEWLAYYAREFSTVEINESFYRLPDRTTVARWAQLTPPSFIFAAKMSRYISHARRLRDPAPSIHRFLQAIEPLGDKLGPILLQLPPRFHVNEDLLRQFIRSWPKQFPLAIEFRDSSWHNEVVFELLQENGICSVWADRASQSLSPLITTTDFLYLRLHQGSMTTASYRPAVLETWRTSLNNTHHSDAFVYFNNDFAGAAIRNARTFVKLVNYASTNEVVPSTSKLISPVR